MRRQPPGTAPQVSDERGGDVAWYTAEDGWAEWHAEGDRGGGGRKRLAAAGGLPRDIWFRRRR